MKNIFSSVVGVARIFGTATLLVSQSAQADEALLQPGTSLGQFPTTSISSLQNIFAQQIVSDVTPDPSLLPSNTFRWLLVKTDTGFSVTLPANYEGKMMHFGQKEKFFVRFNLTTGLPEISFDLATWQPYTAGTPVDISREEQTTILTISSNLQTLNTLQEEQQALTDDLASKQTQLDQTQEQLDQLQLGFDVSTNELATTNANLTSQETTRTTLETTLKPEAKLRTDTHPIVANTTLDDTTKTNLTQTALNTYDIAASTSQIPARSPASAFVPPTTAEVQSTITLLTQELSRIQTQINTVSSQITAKQNEITTTQNSINTTQESLDQLTAQLTQYMNDYAYWRDEYNRLVGLRDAASNDLTSIRNTYSSDRSRLMTEGVRSDVPSNLDATDIVSQISSLKTRINNEVASIGIAGNSWGTDTTTKNLPDAAGPTLTRLSSSYYYYSDFYSLTKSYPATVRMYLKPVGSSSFSQSSTTYTAYNANHLAAIITNTAKPILAKLCDYTFADKVLETDMENYLSRKTDYNAYVNDAATAFGNRQTAQTNVNTAQPLVDQRQSELNFLNTQKSTLNQQKTDLETLKNTEAQLQILYNRVKAILDQLQQHVTSHNTITAEITNLVSQAQQLEAEIANLQVLITTTEGDKADLINQIASTSDDITIVQNSLTQTEQQLLTILQNIPNIIHQDAITRKGTILIPASQSAAYFADGYRTGYFSTTLAGLPAKWITRYEWMGAVNDIYPAYSSIQYVINGRAYCTDAQRMNNFSHKELVNGYMNDAVTKLNTCIALLNRYPAGSSGGIENFLSSIKAQIANLQVSKSTNATIKDHVVSVNDFTKKTLLQGGSYALFEQLLSHNTIFANKITEITTVMAQKGNIVDGTDAMNDLRHMVTTIYARAFAERLITTGTDGLDTYTHWEQESLSFINGIGDASTLTNQLDMNSDWSIDVQGNKYKFGLYHPAGLGTYNPPATLFMMYSPDGINTQVIGPVEVKSGTEADTMKARWQQELLKMKRLHADYSGGAYDIFRGTDEVGQDVWWGQSNKDGAQKIVTFSGNINIVQKSAQTLLERTNITSNLSSNEAFYRSLFGLPYDYFSQSAQNTLNGLIQLSDQNLSLAINQILSQSLDISVWDNHQKEVAKVIVSLSGVSGFPADQVNEFQRKAIQQLDTLGVNYEQRIIDDTLNTGRKGGVEEIRTVVVLQKLSQLFMKKKLEMNAVSSSFKLSSAEQTASSLYALPITGYYSGMKRLYFAIEESAGESNVKRNIELLKLCSGDTTLDPGGYVKFLGKRIDLSDMGNILLGYNAKQLGLTLEETVFGAFVAQGTIESLKNLNQSYSIWQKNSYNLGVLMNQLQFLVPEIITDTFNNEAPDKELYSKGYYMSDTSPIGILIKG